jgi:hypothetical protein
MGASGGHPPLALFVYGKRRAVVGRHAMTRLAALGLGVAIIGGWAMTDSDATQAAGAPLLDGSWGGIQIQLVMDTKGGHVAMSCADGTISGPVALGRDGKFSAKGTFQQYGGGPQRADEKVVLPKARYSGQVTDGMMMLSILPAGSRTPQVFHLRKGARSKIIRCL